MEDARGEEAAEAAGLFPEGLPVAASALGASRAAAAAPPGYLGHRDRLRRRLVGGGPAALLDHELLEIVLFLARSRFGCSSSTGATG
jgi:DNA repair protein RadC